MASARPTLCASMPRPAQELPAREVTRRRSGGPSHGVHVLGNAGVDIVLQVGRAPDDGETLTARSVQRAPGGKGLNQAVVAARSGARVRFHAVLGDDADARLVRGALAREPFGGLSLATCTQPTDLSVVIVDDAGGNRIVSTSACADALSLDDATAFAAALHAGDVLLMQGNLSRDATQAAARVAAARGADVVLNLAPFRWTMWEGPPACHVVLNRVEAAQATGLQDPHAAARRLSRAGARSAIVTLGAQGCVVADAAGCRHHRAYGGAAVDTTGAGDTFCGVLAAGMARGGDRARIIEAAQRAAAITVSRRGAFAALPSVRELAALGRSLAFTGARRVSRSRSRP